MQSVSSSESDEVVGNTSFADDIVSMEDVESLLNTFDEITVEIDAGLHELIEGYSKLNIHDNSSSPMEKTVNEGNVLHSERFSSLFACELIHSYVNTNKNYTIYINW